MTLKERIEMIEESTARRIKIMEDKGPVYAGKGGDVNSNFKRLAEHLGTTSQAICVVYMMKHIDAIVTYIQTGRQTGEGVEGSLDDARNYLDILESLIMEGG